MTLDIVTVDGPGNSPVRITGGARGFSISKTAMKAYAKKGKKAISETPLLIELLCYLSPALHAQWIEFSEQEAVLSLETMNPPYCALSWCASDVPPPLLYTTASPV